MLDSEKIAVAAHLHVLLRRKTGRVTDTEWMVENADYARAIVRFARQKAQEERVPELAEYAAKLEAVVLGVRPARPAAAMPAAPAMPPAMRVDEEPADPAAPRYVGGIR